MHPLKRRHPLRRLVLTSAATVSGLVLLLSLKPHTTAGSAAGTAPLPATAAGTATGTSVPTRYGPVQVRVEVSGGRITNVTVLARPDGNPRDRQINAYAVPRLTQETLTAQSAHVDTVSGATYTSGGYRRSLQSALDSLAG
ncbi:FMN-binding protein [Streptomyces sp. V2]|uniref:FMN-binding protein n=1 Tax=Streptomyces sp. V2 TaxID=1424099 RepID=UPI000D66ECF1|nr:FMN-binding protein [Streptomyces sp. V2]PWG15293.1 FMN-binding protein [Streptomyces sp. V2]